ncbi:MAG: (5-formylfuran-3-yl)methyl phosphate synthase [Pirellulales bacterium]
MTRLLVSVRDAAEAAAALAGGAHLIDIKEPRRGSLGAADPSAMADVVRAVAGHVPVSAALGELLEPNALSAATVNLAQLAGLSYAKLGLAGCRRQANWPDQWAQALQRLPSHMAAVAVAYADDAAAAAPAPAEVLHHAVRLHCRAMLIDTFDKSRGGLLDHWTLPNLADFARQARHSGLLVVLAGSLDARTARLLLPLQPDYLAVRGAVCEGDRAGAVQTSRVRAFAALLEDHIEAPATM